MRVDVVVDVGNTRIKCGLCEGADITETVALSHDSSEWEPHRIRWSKPMDWAISGVAPAAVADFAKWLRAQFHRVTIIESAEQIPIQTKVKEPAGVGLDRLFDAVAAARRFPQQQLLVIDAGTAITINVVSSDGAFRGGAILPGLRLMAQSLNRDTAQLPVVNVSENVRFPGKTTDEAIQSGILAASVGAIERCARKKRHDILVFTGGAGAMLYGIVNSRKKELVPELTLEGIRIAAEALP